MKFIFLIMTILFCFNSFAVQKARVVAKRATVYSDLKLTSPVGTIPFGKYIYVGNVKRRHGTVLPTVISGKIAYILVKDIALEKDMVGEKNKKINVTEHDVSVTMAEAKDGLNLNNYMVLSGSMLSMGENWNNLSELFGDSPSGLMGVKLNFQHRPKVHNWSWGAGFGYYFTSQQYINFNVIALDINVYYSVVPLKYVTFDLLGGTTIGLSSKFKTNDDKEYGTTMLGLHAGGQMKIFPRSKLGVVAGAKYSMIQLNETDPITLPESSTLEISSLDGLEFYAGLSYKF